MGRLGDNQPPAGDARPVLPTEIEPPYPPAQDARPFLPTEVEPPYPPAPAGPAYPATRTGFSTPGPARPSYTPGHASPAEPGRVEPGRVEPGRADPAQSAEHIWRTGRPAEAPPRRWRRLAGTALTVVLLAATAVVLYLRLHHAPFHVTGVAITQRTQSGCGVDVTGQISTNGAAGTVTYQWVIRPDQQAPQPLTQSVVAGQDQVDVTVAVQGSGHGSASRGVTLQVLSPDLRTFSTSVHLRC
jgi:hypothetical protein